MPNHSELGVIQIQASNVRCSQLHIACHYGQNAAKYLITEQKCNPNSRDQHGWTPLYYASEDGHLNIIQCLITELGCYPNTPSQQWRSPTTHCLS